MRSIIFVIGAGVLMLAVLFFSFSGGDGNSPVPLESQNIAAESSGTTSTKAQTVEQIKNTEDQIREYRNVARGFSVRYPKELSVKEYDEGDGAATIVFEDAAGEKSFQVFFTPYLGDAITQSRILKDVPSGKFTEPVEIVIGGGTRALMFFSEGPLGQLREVWFLRNGFLYEVTAYAYLDEWLSHIISTWNFLAESSVERSP